MVRQRAGPFKCTPLSFTGPGGAGSIIGNARLPMAFTEPLLHARQGSASHQVRIDGKQCVLTQCQACKQDRCDPYHFLLECTHDTVRVAQTRAHALVRGIATGITERARELVQRLPEAGAEPMLEPLARAEAALGRMSAVHWHTPMGKAIQARLAFAQPWSAGDLPPLPLNQPESLLALALGSLFDAINWPPFLTHRLCTQWAFKASKLHRICNTARDATHRTHPAWRRGGSDRYAEAVEAAADAAQIAADVAETSADAAAAVVYRATHGGDLPAVPRMRSPKQKRQRKKRGAARAQQRRPGKPPASPPAPEPSDRVLRSASARRLQSLS